MTYTYSFTSQESHCAILARLVRVPDSRAGLEFHLGAPAALPSFWRRWFFCRKYLFVILMAPSCLGPSCVLTGTVAAWALVALSPAASWLTPVLLRCRTLPGGRVPHWLWPVCRESAACPLSGLRFSLLSWKHKA